MVRGAPGRIRETGQQRRSEACGTCISGECPCRSLHSVVLADSSAAVVVEEPKQENENTVRNANRAQGRKEAAKRRQRISDIEKETTKLEAEQKELEAKFSGSCDEADIKRYGEIAELLTKLYDEYFELNED